MASHAPRPGDIIQGINVTPLVDVVLVLLIVLMVAASHAVSRALPLDLPRASTGESSDPSPLAISVDATGTLFLDGEALSKEELRQRVRRHGASNDRRALIAAEGSAEHRDVVGVIDLLRSEGVSRFAINVAPEELGP